MNRMVEIMDTWLRRQSEDPEMSHEEFFRMKEERRIMGQGKPLSDFVKRPLIREIDISCLRKSHYQVIMEEKRRKKEEKAIRDMFRERTKINWRYARQHMYLNEPVRIGFNHAGRRRVLVDMP